MNTQTSVENSGGVEAFRSKLDTTWSDINKANAVDFLKRSIGPRTTVSELLAVLSYDKVQAIKDQLSDVTLSEVVQQARTTTAPRAAAPKVQATAPVTRKAIRIRSSKASIEQEMGAVLQVLRANPGINRGALAKKVKAQLGNKSLAHVSYLLRKLGEAGQVRQSGERKGATYEAA